MILKASSKKVTTIKNLPMAGKYGLIGSEYVSRRSSILLVCSRIASSGEGSFVAEDEEGPPPKLLFIMPLLLPRW